MKYKLSVSNTRCLCPTAVEALKQYLDYRQYHSIVEIYRERRDSERGMVYKKMGFDMLCRLAARELKLTKRERYTLSRELMGVRGKWS